MQFDYEISGRLLKHWSDRETAESWYVSSAQTLLCESFNLEHNVIMGCGRKIFKYFFRPIKKGMIGIRMKAWAIL